MEAKMRKMVLLWLAILIVASAVLARQEPTIEYGKPEEFKGVTRFFIDTGTDLSKRDKIVRQIKKKLPALIFVDRTEDADILLVYSEEQSPRLVRGTSLLDPLGTGYAMRQIDASRIRILWNFRMKKKNMFQNEPSTNFANDFVKEYKKANGAN
jgi:hypothetical protein